MSDSRAGDGDFVGIDPAGMGSLVSAMSRSAETLNDGVEYFRLQLGDLGVDTSPLSGIAQIASWAGAQNLMLARRHQLAIALDNGGTGLRASRAASEQVFLSPAQAKAKGTWLAERFMANESSGNYSWVLAELAKYDYDPDVTAAFFAKLGPAQTEDLPALINGFYDGDNQVPDAARDMTILSEAFGTAVMGGDGVPGFAAARDALLNPDDDPSVAAAAVALIAHANLPPDYLAAVVNANLSVAASESQVDSASYDPAILAGLLTALANNPAAARIVFTGAPTGQPFPHLPDGLGLTLTEPTPSPTQQIIERFDLLAGQADAAGDPQIAADLGKAYAAAAGADDETDGQHSEAAASFALALITTLPQSPWSSEDQGDLSVPESMKPYLAKIAGAYAAEFTVAANWTLPGHEQSSMQVPSTSIPGLTAQFSLSPRDAYEFLETFADTNADMAPFNAAMGQLSQRLITVGVRTAQSSDDPTPLTKIMTALGSMAGLQFAAEVSVRGALDAADAHRRAVEMNLAGAAISAVGLVAPEGGLAAEALWDATLYGAGQAADAEISSGAGQTRIAQLEEANRLAALAAPDTIVRIMLDVGYNRGYTTPPPAQITSPNGKLLPIDQIVDSQSRYHAYVAWLIANSQSESNAASAQMSFGSLANNATNEMLGQAQKVQDAVQQWGG